MSYEFEDTETLAIDADWLNLFEPPDGVSSPRRPVLRCKNLFWWIECYPNGVTDDENQNVSVGVYTSTIGFELTRTVTVLRSDVKEQDTEFRSKNDNEGWVKVISHDKLRRGDIIKDGIFSIKVDVKFKIPKATINAWSKLELFEDSYTIKFDRKMIETYQPGQRVVEQKQTVGGITWWSLYYPCGETEKEKGYVSVYFAITGGPIMMEASSAMSINGAQSQLAFFSNFDEIDFDGVSKSFSHKLVKHAHHKNDIIDIVCKIRFFTPSEPTFEVPAKEKPNIPTKIKDLITISFLECQLDDNDIGEFDSTPKEFVKDSDTHQWRLKCFPAGDSFGGKKHVSLFVEASTTEKKTVTMSGVIRILGTTFEKKFNMIVETDSLSGFPKLISHEELRRIGGIVNNQVTITCDATFQTFNDLSLY